MIATALNIGSQTVSLEFYDGSFALSAAMVMGTGVGLVAKYALDRKWIFFDRVRSPREHGATFGLYTVMGVVTTAIFWGAELVAHAIHPDLTLIGATLGLAVGYVAKYRLDRRFVFAGGQR
ncbi:MAG: GtrA family protein [Alphaproteobacteria bacterium]|nr:GtrA family protein [Alphaproteobacteria bacterium]